MDIIPHLPPHPRFFNKWESKWHFKMAAEMNHTWVVMIEKNI